MIKYSATPVKLLADVPLIPEKTFGAFNFSNCFPRR